MTRRPSLKSLARSRGYLAATLAADTNEWVGRAWLGHDGVDVVVGAPTRVAADAGLRAALEALPRVVYTLVCRDLCGDMHVPEKGKRNV